MYLVYFVGYTQPGVGVKTSFNSAKVRSQAFVGNVLSSLPELKRPEAEGEDVGDASASEEEGEGE